MIGETLDGERVGNSRGERLLHHGCNVQRRCGSDRRKVASGRGVNQDGLRTCGGEHGPFVGEKHRVIEVVELLVLVAQRGVGL